MKGKNLLYLVGVLIVAIAAIILSNKLGDKKPSAQSLQFFPGLTSKNISSVLIINSTGASMLHRKGDVWVVSPGSNDQMGKSIETSKGALNGSSSDNISSKNFPTDSASVATVIDKITSMKKDVLISENPNKQKLFEVDSTTGTYVEVWDQTGKSIGAVKIGKSGPDWSSNYVRQIGSNSVYNVNGSIGYSFFSETSRWRDKKITKIDKSVITKVTLTKKDGSVLTIAKADSGNSWKITEPVTDSAKLDKVDDMISAISLLNADSFEDSTVSDSALGFNNPEAAVVVYLGNQATKKLLIGNKKGTTSNYYVKIDGNETIFLVPEYEVNRISKKLEDVKVEPPKPEAKAAATPKASKK